MFRGNLRVFTILLVQEDQKGRQDTEEQPKAEDDKVADLDIKRWFTSEVGFLSSVIEEGGDKVILLHCFSKDRGSISKTKIMRRNQGGGTEAVAIDFKCFLSIHRGESQPSLERSFFRQVGTTGFCTMSTMVSVSLGTSRCIRPATWEGEVLLIDP